MKKEDLIAMGLTEEQAKKVMESLDGNYVTKSRFNEVNEENKTLKTDIKTRDQQLTDLKKAAGDSEELSKKIESLQQENKQAKKQYDKELQKLKLDNAVERALAGAKAKNVKAVTALLNLEGAELLEDGSVKGLEEQLKTLKKAEDSSFLFEADTKVKVKGVEPGAGKDGVPTPEGSKELKDMSYDEICAYMEANPGTELG